MKAVLGSPISLARPGEPNAGYEREKVNVMSCVDSTLQAGENVTVLAHRHWITYLRPLPCATAGLLSVVASLNRLNVGPASDYAAFMLVGGVSIFVLALIRLVGVW